MVGTADMVLSQYRDTFPERRIAPPILTFMRGSPVATAHRGVGAADGSERANAVRRDGRGRADATETEAEARASHSLGLSSEKYMRNK